jgi:hypothetical protein
LVDATCWEQREIEVKVSRPLKRRYVERLFDVFLGFVSILFFVVSHEMGCHLQPF